MSYLDEALNKSLDEFMEFYKISNVDYIPIFRVKQWEEHNNKDKEIERLQHNQEVSTKWEIKLTQKNTKLKEENKRLKSIIKEVREYIENKEIDTLHFNSKDFLDTSIASELLEILDKVEENTNGKD